MDARFHAAFLALALVAVGSGSRAQTVGMVSDDATHSVVVFDADLDVVRGRVALPVVGTVGDCVVANDGFGYVTDGVSHVWVVDLAAVPPRLDGSIELSGDGFDQALTPDGRFLIVGGYGGPTSVVDLAVRSEVSVSALSHAVAACADGSVLVLHDNGVRRLSLGPTGVLSDIGENWAAPVYFPEDGVTDLGNLECAPSGAFALATIQRRLTTLGVPGLAVLDSDGSLLARGFSGAFAPGGDVFYVRERGGGQDLMQAYRLDPLSGVFATFPIWESQTCWTSARAGLDSIAVHPDGSRLYVSGGASLCVYATATGSLLKTITDPALVDATGVALGRDRVRGRAAASSAPTGSATRGL